MAHMSNLGFLRMIANRDRAMSPVLSLADDPGSFAAIAKKDPPDFWGVTHFYEVVTSPESPLHAFTSGDVREISYSVDRHDHLLMGVHFQNKGVPIVWLRAENKGTRAGTIRFSADRSKLRSRHSDDIMVTTFATLNFLPVLDLLHLVFANAVLSPMSISIGILHRGFGGSWVKPPSPNWLKQILNFFATHAATIEFVQHQFAIQHPDAEKVSLGELEAWNHEPASLSQPPSSKQDSRGGPDSNLAGMKGKIAYIGSAPPLSVEYLRGPHPMQSPNVNGAVADVVTDTEKNGGDWPRGIKHSNVFAPYDLHHHPTFQTRKNPLSHHTPNERQPAQPVNPSSIPTLPKEISTRTDEAMSILQDVMTTAPSAEALGQGSQTSPSFTNPEPSPPETPNLTRHIIRLGTTPMATGGYSSVWRGSLLSAASAHPDEALQVAIKVLRASHADEDTLKRKLHKRLHVEMRIWAQLHHENVVRLLGHTEEPEGPGLVSISYPHGNVLGFLVKNPTVNREVIVRLHPYTFSRIQDPFPTEPNLYNVRMLRWDCNTCLNTGLKLYMAI